MRIETGALRSIRLVKAQGLGRERDRHVNRVAEN